MNRARASLIVIAATFIASSIMFARPSDKQIQLKTAIVQEGDLIQSTVMACIVDYEQRQPSVAVYGGKVSQVYVKAGDRVSKGQLLMRIDTTSEEKLFAEMQQARFAREAFLDSTAEPVAVLTASQSMEWLQSEEQLLQRIEAAQVRSQNDGIVEAVYVKPGEYVGIATVLCIIRSENRCLFATQSIQKSTLLPDTFALIQNNGQTVGTAMLSRVSLSEDRLMQQLCFVPTESGILEQVDIGSLLTLEIVDAKHTDVSLIPLAAINAAGEVWIVENQKASPIKISTTVRNSNYVAINEAWAGKRVILMPDEYALMQGCYVEEAGSRWKE